MAKTLIPPSPSEPERAQVPGGPPVRAADLLTMSAGHVAIHRDLTAHNVGGYVLDYRILSLMPANDVIAHFGLT